MYPMVGHIGTRIVYERAFLLQLRNSPISRTPPKDLANFPGRMLKGVDIQKDDIISSPSKPGRGAHKLYLAGLEEEKRIEAEQKKQQQEDKEKIKNQSEEFQANNKVSETKL
uniref:Uncharacterized protein n=1 Tax=Timema poppense TaxID=170557 RepID=A0A7R9HDQ4_TIMPO|nr:unnamed protein product [Timema poppensis]